MKLRIFFTAIAVLASIWLMSSDFSLVAHAQVDPGLEAVGQTIALPDTDPRILAARIINIFLGLLSIIFLVIILYAGFLWMTAGGNSDQITKAKAWLRNGIIGLIIILFSWAIASFVINSLINAATGGPGGGGPGGGGFGPGSGDVFRIMAKSPEGSVGNADLVIRVLFNRDVDGNTLDAFSLSPQVSGSWVVDPTNAKRVIFTPTDPCPGAPQKGCFAFDTQYTVTISTNLRSTANQQLRCGGFYPNCTFTFTAGNKIDTQSPVVTIMNLYNGKSVPVNSAVEVLARAVDDIGISGMDFEEGGQIFGSEGPSAVPSPTIFESSGFWDTVGKTLKQTYTITVSASDLDTNTGKSSVDVVVLDQHCFDNIQNNDETGIDCGGVDCLSCNGGPCQENSQCASDMCLNGVCVEQPIITSVKPLSGREGTYVSIWGDNFGDTGTVTFMGPPEVVAQAPQACVNVGSLTWSNNYALVEVPVGAATGPLSILNANSNLIDTTDDERGPKFIFEVNDQEVPGICSANPNSGLPGTSVQLSGVSLGDSGGFVRFGNMTPTHKSWSASVISFLAPVSTPGLYPVWIVNKAGIESNKVPFTVKSTTAPEPAPVITFLDPAQGPRGQYITIVGERFGSVPGVVRFYDKATDKIYTGDAAFPQGCSAGWWRNNNIVIKVPSVDSNVVKPAQFSIYIERSDSVRSNRLDFTYTDGVPGPGICTINPSSGPVGTYVELHGENFGSAVSGNQVIFTNGQQADIQSWQANKIDVIVPTQAITGSVFATISGVDTNSVQFAVADCRDNASVCSTGQTCCPNGTCVDGACGQQSFSALYGWQFSTGIIPKAPRVVEFCDPTTSGTQLPSPTPYINHKGGDQVCVSVKPVIGVLFDIPIQWPPAQSPNNLFSLKKCTGTGIDPCSALENVEITTPNLISGGDPYVYFEPVNNLEPSTTYYVFVNREIRSADLQYGTVMDENTSCPEPGLGYCYRFRTRSDTGPCAIGKVYINPWRAYVEGNEEQKFEALPAIKDAECTMVDCSGFDFDWNTDPISKAWLKSSLTPFACKQTVISGDQEAVSPPVKVSAVESTSNRQGLADLFIQYIVPKVVDKFPECDTACSNIIAWAQMNTSLWSDPPPAGVNTVELPDPIKHGNYYKNVKVFRCATENCFTESLSEIPIIVKLEPLSPLIQYQNIPYSFISISPVQDLAPGTYYKIWLNGGAGNSIASKHGVALPVPVSWRFRTRLENEQCLPDSVKITPAQKIEDKIYSRQLFTARIYSEPDSCRVDGQLLKINQSFSWSFTDPAQQVVSYYTPSIDTGAILPPGCSANCLARGSNGVFGKIAVCGNNIVETTDSNYCQGGVTPAGQPCVVMPMESGAGEQCDGGPLCNPNNCLFQPVTGPSCGNGVVDYTAGEMCDPGTRCYDAVNDASMEGVMCLTQAMEDACFDAGGVCEKRAYQGCGVNCRNLGSSAESTSFCGNGGTPGAGEDCDQGADNGKGGCSNDCLHVGSSPSVVSVCGNGILEAGETCEASSAGQPVPTWCDPVRCIKLGTPLCASPSSPACCGNNIIDEGEECDDGNKVAGDGCSLKCLYEGSSWKYKVPSFCGDGIVGTGELCDSVRHTTGAPVNNSVAGVGDGLIDPIQLAVIDPGLGTLDPVTKVMQAELACTYSGITGNAIYGVGCGKTKESDCEPGYGLDANGCCAPRPAFAVNPAPFPSGNNNNQGFCRNVMIEVKFAEPMDVQSVLGNFTIAKEIVGNDCPAGSSPLVLSTPVKGFWSWISAKWHELLSWIKGEPAYAVYCTNTVPGSLITKGASTTAFVYRLSQALDPNTNYIVRFEADPNVGLANDDNKKQGIRTKRGVVGLADAGDDITQNNWQYTWWFKTGNDICRVDNILIEDLGKKDPSEDYSPFYFYEAFEEHLFIATAQSIKNGFAQSIAPIQGLYEWLWQPWVVNNPKLALNNDEPIYTQPSSQSAIRVSDISGYAWVFASLKITVDTLDKTSTAGSIVSNSKPITVFICNNPWPPRVNKRFEPFRDADKSMVLDYSNLWLADLYTDLYSSAPNGPFFNFQTLYCRDHENGVMPSLHPKYIPLSQSDQEAGILRQYLFTYEEAAYKSDGIGIRIYKNPYKDTPLEWYRRQGFLGSPQSITVDGYPAIRDGGTVYIGFPNTYGRNESIYPNILVMSHNIGASPITERIFDSLLSNFAFNINFSFDNGNVCVSGGETGVSSGEVYINPTTGGPVVCVSDYDCLKVDNSPNPKLRCSSFKYKLQHDIKRLADFKDIQKALDSYYTKNGRYPVLSEGSFQKAITNSLWPSWQQTLGAELGISMPIDPVNRLITCGLCKPNDNPAAQSTIPCVKNDDCVKDHFCEAQNGYDPATCWNTDTRQFMCPYMSADGAQPAIKYSPYEADEPFAPSRFYSYQSFEGGRRFQLGANFEISPMAYVYSNGNPLKTDSWWEAPYFVELRYCRTNNPISNGRWCASNDDCKPCIDPSSPTCTEPAPANSCQPTGFRYQFKNICSNDITGDSSVCGDKVKGMVCSAGPKVYQSCSNDTDCDGFACEYEFCELDDTKLVTCDYSSEGAQDGFMLTVCQNCTSFVVDPILSICQPKVKCGNGRIDGYCGGVPTADACTKDTDCAEGVTCVLQEVCDDGVLNGTYGHCNTSCTGYDKYCGDGQLSPGEICDRGSDISYGNGAYCSNPSMCYEGTSGAVPLSETCGLGCQGKAPYCGDGKTNGPEQCDGQVSRTASAICSAGPRKEQPCQSNVDCLKEDGNNFYCGPQPAWPPLSKINSFYKSCAGVTRTRCATAAQICLSDVEASALQAGNYFNNNPDAYKTYQGCTSDAGCPANKKCISLSLGIGCSKDEQCSNSLHQGVCREYATEHIRSCQAPGTVDQCKWEPNWSACTIAHFCGDGVIDPGEECDDGPNNATNKACLPTCKKNVCGDGYMHTNVEECDAGVNNGKSTCDASYGSTCNDCSLQCKIVAKAGGYCGNGIKEPGEQCDGNILIEAKNFTPATDYITGADLIPTDASTMASKKYIGTLCEKPPCQVMQDLNGLPTNLTCQQLGYDFAINSDFNTAILVTNWSHVKSYIPKEAENMFWYEPPEGMSGFLKLTTDTRKNSLLNKVLWDCGLLHDISLSGALNLQWKPQTEWPTPFDFRQCVNLYGIKNGFRMVSDANAKPACSTDCKPAGCGRCSDEIGDGKIFGYVMDRIWLQPVPSARVTLQYRGINIDQIMTDINGRFEFKNLSTRGDCDQFRLVIDKYDNNICTELANNRPADGCLSDIATPFNRAIDEGKNGGYWSYTTENFSVESFPYKEMMGMIYIYPRPAKGEGYVTYGRPQLFTNEAWQRVKDCKNSGDELCLINNVSISLSWSKFWEPHIVWPVNQARLHPWSGSGVVSYSESKIGTFGYDLCTYNQRGTANQHSMDPGRMMSCARDYNWMNQGDLNLSAPPYAAMACPSLMWDFDRTSGCPLVGTKLCAEQCVSAKGFWRLVYDWTGMTFSSTQCDKYCKVGTSCPKDSGELLTTLNKCHLMMNNAQSTGFFRYQDVPNLNEPINIYFSGAEYEPIRGEYYYTAPLTTAEFNAWTRETNPQKPEAYNSLTELPDRALSWREAWAKTNIKVYVSTDKGLYAITPIGGNTRDDFRRPFWHIASIETNGQVGIVNSWRTVSELGLPKESGKLYYPNTPLTGAIKYTKTALRPSGLACWNIFGAACQQVNGMPWTLSCVANEDKGILKYYTFNQTNESQKNIWSLYFSRQPIINDTAICDINESAIRYNAINW